MVREWEDVSERLGVLSCWAKITSRFDFMTYFTKDKLVLDFWLWAYSELRVWLPIKSFQVEKILLFHHLESHSCWEVSKAEKNNLKKNSMRMIFKDRLSEF